MVPRVTNEAEVRAGSPSASRTPWAIAAKEVYDACRRAGMDEGSALAFAMDRSSYPDWIVDPKDPIKNPLDDFDEDDD